MTWLHRLYSSPLKVYLLLGLISLLGVVSGFHLPISLFPNTSKPEVEVSFNFEESPEDFVANKGTLIEGALKAISTDQAKVDQLTSTYSSGKVRISVEFTWGSDPKASLREVQTVMGTQGALLSARSREGMSIYSYTEGGGYYAVSFYSDQIDLTSLYKLVKNAVGGKLAQVPDAEEAEVENPETKQVNIELDPLQMAKLGVWPSQIENQLASAFSGRSAGALESNNKSIPILFEASAAHMEQLRNFPIFTASSPVPLSDLARIELATPPNGGRTMKTSGTASVLIFASPKSGGNVKQMAEDVGRIVTEALATLPSHVHTKVLVDPSVFIRSSVSNVLHEVLLAAFLCVLILYLFFGSIKNVITAAIEIPISLVMAFILMKISHMNLNLISLGGLALSAGMNVDGSVVVMENIFRHFEGKQGLSHRERLDLIIKAVREVSLPIIASTIASIVVFLPLIFTSGLGSAILGDLAKAVLFSHGFSAIVALILVPTVRLQMLKTETKVSSHQGLLEKPFTWLENVYVRHLEYFLGHRKLQNICYLGLVVTLVVLSVFVAPRIPKEVIGRPETDFIWMQVSSTDNTMIKQMETDTDEVDSRLRTEFSKEVDYTFSQVHWPSNGGILIHLREKSMAKSLKEKLEKAFGDTSRLRFYIESWNPSELPIPDPPQLKISIKGPTSKIQAEATRELNETLSEQKVFQRLRSRPEVDNQGAYSLRFKSELIPGLIHHNISLTSEDLVVLTQILTTGGRRQGQIKVDDEYRTVQLLYPKGTVSNLESYESFPVAVDKKVIPLKALADIKKIDSTPDIYRRNQESLYLLTGREPNLPQKELAAKKTLAENIVNKFQKDHSDSKAIVTIEDADEELNTSLKELGLALFLSLILIFVTLVLQLGSVMDSILVMIAIPLGFVGVLLSLWIFRSTVSINSALGVILLSGIVVANSIILVDFINRRIKEGLSAAQAACDSARQRLRPILLTSATTGLGMLPIALGFGEGGQVLQPLGITVVGGLFFSLTTTLFIVPALQVRHKQGHIK